MTRVTFAISVLLVQVLAGCSSGVKGTYTNSGGMVMLELGSGGKATFSLGGDIKTCTYTADDKSIVLSCGRGEQGLAPKRFPARWTSGSRTAMERPLSCGYLRVREDGCSRAVQRRCW